MVSTIIYIDFKITWKEKFSTKNIILTTVNALILRKFDKFWLDLDLNLFGSCSNPGLDPEPNEQLNQDPDPDKVGTDPQHC